MFISLRELYKMAEEKNVGIGAFNTNNLEITQAIVSAAEELSLPLIVQTTPGAIEYAGLKELFGIVKTLIDESAVPLTIHLDHAKEIDLINRCLDIGYKSVMFDGSDLLFENNVSETKKVVDLAHKYGALVEGEIGVVGRSEEGREKVLQKYTDPDQAVNFVRLTGVDALAVSIGNVHGGPTKEKIDLDLLKKIDQVVDVPLVLHGASGLSGSDIVQAIKFGIRKINIDTQIKRSFKKGLQENIDDPDKDLRDYLSDAREDAENTIKKYLRLFNNIE
ncbi:MAG: class II fructose-bisphosphate aldolase [Patescibacteria group bacterium]|nr:class II fructose-bisphosphate aldolase [Patescibacteria group bacterium]